MKLAYQRLMLQPDCYVVVHDLTVILPLFSIKFYNQPCIVSCIVHSGNISSTWIHKGNQHSTVSLGCTFRYFFSFSQAAFTPCVLFLLTFFPFLSPLLYSQFEKYLLLVHGNSISPHAKYFPRYFTGFILCPTVLKLLMFSLTFHGTLYTATFSHAIIR